MKILLIGGTSAIGTALNKCLSEKNDVVVTGRSSGDIHLNLENWYSPPFIAGKFDAVIHLAADFGGDTDFDFRRTELINSVGTLIACSIAKQVGAKHFVLLSSLSATYDHHSPYYDIYSLSKKHGEETAQLYCTTRGIDLTILRPSQIYDDLGHCRNHQKILYMMYDFAEQNKEIEIYGTNDALRNYIHLADLIRVVESVIEQGCFGKFIVAHPESVRLTEMANKAFAAFDREVKLVFLREKPSLLDLPEIIDYEIYQRIDYFPRITIDEGFRRIRFIKEASK